MYESNKQVVSYLVDIKLHLSDHGNVISDKSEEYKSKLVSKKFNNITSKQGAMEAAIHVVQQDNTSMSSFMSKHQGSAEVTVHNIDELVKPIDAISEKLIDLQSKNSSLEDTMQVMKKAYAKDNFSTEEYLKIIRDLSKKQFKCVYKC